MEKEYSANICHQIFISRWKSSLHYADNRQMTTLGASMEHEYIVTWRWGKGGGRPVPLLAIWPQVHDRRMAGVLIPNIHRPNSPPPPTQPFPSISIYKTISTNSVRGKTSNRIIMFGKKKFLAYLIWCFACVQQHSETVLHRALEIVRSLNEEIPIVYCHHIFFASISSSYVWA